MSTSINIGPCDCCGGGGCCVACPGGIGTTQPLHVTVVNLSGAACIDGLSVAVTGPSVDGSCQWSGLSAVGARTCCACASLFFGVSFFCNHDGTITAYCSVEALFGGLPNSGCIIRALGAVTGAIDCTTPSFATGTLTFTAVNILDCGRSFCDPTCLLGAQIQLVIGP